MRSALDLAPFFVGDPSAGAFQVAQRYPLQGAEQRAAHTGQTSGSAERRLRGRRAVLGCGAQVVQER
ncbi:hypothetical protein GCM10010385_54980 [Streptomyces geysiriensis]|nr:hypothetical protein GCM10010385_54980 [Streptomyces geysiriensis]